MTWTDVINLLLINMAIMPFILAWHYWYMLRRENRRPKLRII